MFHTTDRGEPVSERGKSVSVADENISSGHLKRVTGEVSSSSEVPEHLLETTVGPSDAIVAGDGPGDVRSEELPKGSAGAARVEVVLRLVQSVEKVDRSVAVHCRPRCGSSNELALLVARQRLARRQFAAGEGVEHQL